MPLLPAVPLTLTFQGARATGVVGDGKSLSTPYCLVPDVLTNFSKEEEEEEPYLTMPTLMVR